VLDGELTCFSFRNEVISLSVSIFIGVMIGLFCSFAPQADEWPTEEMAGRGDVSGLIAGIAIAIPRYVMFFRWSRADIKYEPLVECC
jgi:hypothetical protein